MEKKIEIEKKDYNPKIIKQVKKHKVIKNNNNENLSNLGCAFPYGYDNVALSILTGIPSTNMYNIEKYRYSPLFHEDYNDGGGNPFTLYRKDLGEEGIVYGNVWIQLTGCKNNDYEAANYYARYMGLFDGGQPEGYTWHHVYMGWLGEDFVLDDGISTQYLLDNSDVYVDTDTYDNEFFDASDWKSTTDVWEPFECYSLMQLVNTSALKFCKEYWGSTEQYKEISDEHHTHPMYQPIFCYED
ncbi:hypothetical protein FACS189465_2880 [Clostridia bacterium]|nr:hypothetical protein FACS189465_2880 [Clostridia bacterium]